MDTPGCIVLGPTHMVKPEVLRENLIAITMAVKEYGSTLKPKS